MQAKDCNFFNFFLNKINFFRENKQVKNPKTPKLDKERPSHHKNNNSILKSRTPVLTNKSITINKPEVKYRKNSINQKVQNFEPYSNNQEKVDQEKWNQNGFMDMAFDLYEISEKNPQTEKEFKVTQQ